MNKKKSYCRAISFADMFSSSLSFYKAGCKSHGESILTKSANVKYLQNIAHYEYIYATQCISKVCRQIIMSHHSWGEPEQTPHWHSRWENMIQPTDQPTIYVPVTCIPKSAKFSRVFNFVNFANFQPFMKMFQRKFLTCGVQCARAAKLRSYFNKIFKNCYS